MVLENNVQMNSRVLPNSMRILSQSDFGQKGKDCVTALLSNGGRPFALRPCEILSGYWYVRIVAPALQPILRRGLIFR
jgi:hypothetical protein